VHYFRAEMLRKPQDGELNKYPEGYKYTMKKIDGMFYILIKNVKI
jgi:hypothetical protein